MIRNLISLLLTTVFLLFGCGESIKNADLVLLNGKILTLEPDFPEVNALAVSQGKIIAIGSREEIESYIGQETKIIDLKGQLAIPGFIEGHGHYMRLGEILTQLELRKAKTWQEIINMVEESVAEAEPGDWIVGWGWHQDKWEESPSPSIEGLPLHHELSKISPENPVLLNHTSGHGSFANLKAMEIAGVNINTNDPEGGEIVRDSKGEPIGMFRETAADLVKDAYAQFLDQRLPEKVEEDNRNQVKLAAKEAIENGITSFQDMGSSFETIDHLKMMADEGNLPVRLYMAIHDPSEIMESRLADYRMVNYGNNFLTVRCIGEKVLDGALGTHGGWLLEPYTDLPRSHGFNVTPVDEIRRSAELAIKYNYQMAIQGIGDKATRVLLDLYENEFNKNSEKSDLRWRIEHAQVVHPDDLPRFAKLGVIPGIQGIFACSDGLWVEDRLGEQRTRERGYQFRSMIESGAIVMNGTDPPVEDIDPIASFHCSVTRKLSNGEYFYPEQSISREQALRSYTINNAYAAFEEDIKGSLAVGKLADITVLTHDIMTIPEEDILTTEIAYTIIGGEIRYKKQ